MNSDRHNHIKAEYVFLNRALGEIPKILTLLDRNPHSPTYGCFDRNFWHYKIIDFPSGMSQEFLWPLALAWDTEHPGNSYYRSEPVREWVIAGMRYAARSSHRDGSCDDYYLYEKAGGAAAFSLLAFLESYRLLDLEDAGLEEFFARRADWLAGHMESGRLANHQALIALCLQKAGDLLGTDRWEKEKNNRIKTVLSWQNREGWFQEYEGCDPGYHTLTITCLAWLLESSPGYLDLRQALEKAVELALEFVHPDGTFGGEYGSRNTNNYFACGFEIAGAWKPEALWANDRYAEAVERGLTPCFSDDHIIGHHAWSDFLTFRKWVKSRPAVPPARKAGVWLEQAGILIDRNRDTELYAALNKGGVFKLFSEGRMVCADSNFSVITKSGGREKTASAHLVDRYDISIEEDVVEISGRLGWAGHTQMNTLNLLVLRLVMMSVGRFSPNLVRKLLQRLLITGKKRSGIRFTRRFVRQGRGWLVRDSLEAPDWSAVISAGLGCDQTSIYVVMSRTFHKGQLYPFIDLSHKLAGLRPGERLVHERVLP